MAVLVNLVSIFLSFLITVSASDVFHVNSKMTFYPDKEATYFGYSVVLSDMGLHVGAPKAASRFGGGSRPGAVFKCPLSYLDSGNTTCYLIDRDLRMYYPTTLFKDDMWFGAQMAATSDNKLLVCAPRFSKPYQDKHLLAHGICFALGDIRVIDLNPLNDNSRQAIRTDGRRKEFGAYETHLNYYAYGQAGMSMAYTKDHHLIIGAPGVLQWTGTVVNYQHIPGSFRQTTFQLLNSTNPYYTRDLSPDEYFGYSVDSGVFEPSGRVLHVAGAPRSKRGYGQVLIFKPNRNENDPLDIKAKLRGPQLGGYFGATLCTLDLNGDGISDLLVGAPNYATKSDGEITYDQGAVFVYITRTGVSNIILEETGSVMGSGDSGARFGTAIADLGDIDGDGMTDVAIGAPWENGGSGVVYIYRGSTNGLKAKYYQRIYAEGSMGFGISIAKGYDVDRNKCNDLVIGAHDSGSVYMYRSIPTIQVISAIKVPEAKRLRQDASNFTALFCITVPPNKLWSNVEIKLKATVTVDPESRRAESKGDTEYVVTARPGVDTCDEQVISINDQSDMSKPILLKFDLKPVEELDNMVTFPRRGARLSETSALSSSFLIQLQSDCGEDLICTPWLEMTLEPLGSESSHVPGIESRLGAKIIVKNVEEPAYSVKLHVVLPCPPKRLDSSCSLQNLDLVCDLPAPLKRNKTAIWEIDLEYTWDGKASELMIAANLEDPFYQRQVSSGAKELLIKITPHSVLNYTGKTESNASVAVSRETFTKFGDVLFSHYYEITNYGPSDLYDLKIEFLLSEGVYPARTIEGATVENNTLSLDPLILKANSTTAYHIPLLFNLTQFGNLLEANEVLNVTSKMIYYVQYGSITENRTVEVATTLTLEQKTPIWPLVVAVVAGLLVLAAIIFALYKFGFFSRPKKEDLKQLLENSAEGMKESTPSLNLNPLEGNSSNDEALFDSEVE